MYLHCLYVRLGLHLQSDQTKRCFMTITTQVKDVLLHVSRDTWSEFVKLLELFANNAVTKNTLLELAADVLGNVHVDLFHEFR